MKFNSISRGKQILIFQISYAYEEIFNTISHQGITNQNHSELSLHTHQDGYGFFFKQGKTTSIVDDAEKLKPSCIAGGNKMDSFFVENIFSFSKS